ncbi:hypothetical protein A11A3_04019 [Alcanivorax hongdengensis A-11-3]|uniref:CopL family metal-binding regulatory protein n=1 Tax=Alcanivorax hongdengensis A-11-3 TaxID=1177179 RepID=L0WFL3_9GAMM|nr:hypothetical protein [Alcanivorax hongdengensis]EKF75494.1 hypothetical protein A11A3_04019 [Alcanivorax hongdengensis A-11-3]
MNTDNRHNRSSLASLLALLLVAVTLWLPASGAAGMMPMQGDPMAHCQMGNDTTAHGTGMACDHGQTCHCLSLCQISSALPAQTLASNEPPTASFLTAASPGPQAGNPHPPWRPPILTA